MDRSAFMVPEFAHWSRIGFTEWTHGTQTLAKVRE
jgi:hypothetical protein